jgi:TonB family protein
MPACPRCGAPIRPSTDPGQRGDLIGVPMARPCETCTGKERRAKAKRAAQLALALGFTGLIGWRVLTPAPAPAPPTRPTLPEAGVSETTEKIRLINGQKLITYEDYPPAAQRDGREGTVRFEAQVDARGIVSDCVILQSSGHEDLDAATCRLVRQRARFAPGRDSDGSPVGGTYTTRVRWQMAR